MKYRVLGLVFAATWVACAAEVVQPSLCPRWSGAAEAEWTMDYSAALRQAKSDGRWSLLLFTGSWWCPWCQPFEAKVLDTDAWRVYAEESGFYEIELDFPKRDGTGFACWLWDEVFLSANGITEPQATAALKDFYAQQTKYALADADTVVCTNGRQKVTYKRVGYPTMLVLRPDGSVAGRFFPGVRDGYDFQGNKDESVVWSEADAFAAVTNAIGEIIANADTHVTVSVAEECAGMGTVTAVDKTVYTDSSVALAARAAKGFVFAGWYNGGSPAETQFDYRTANNSYVAEGGEIGLTARFASAADDFLAFDFESGLSDLSLYEEVSIPLSIESESAPSVKLTGLPNGLKFDAKTLTVSGTPVKEGFYYVSASAKNASGYSLTQIVKCTVGEPEEPEPSDFDAYVNFSVLEDLVVGEYVDAELGRYSADDKEGITSVSGLPAGLAVRKTSDEDGVTVYSAVGTPTKAGLSTVSVKSTYVNEDGRSVSGTSSAKIAVDDFPSVYLSVDSGANGKATGSGVYAAGAKATLKATPDRGCVFAGWLDGEGGQPVVGEGFDCRDPNLKMFVTQDIATSWYATFSPADEDGSVAISSDDFSEGDLVEFCADDLSGEEFRLSYAVSSISLPTAKVTGLPAGFTYTSGASAQEFEIVYDPATAKKTPVPGYYTVVVTATNKSRSSSSVSFRLKVANWVCEEIDVDDVYPDEIGFTPGAAIEAIDFSTAVEEGLSLSVSGLPRGLTFNAKANAARGVEALTVTGTPTVPGTYTVTFTAKEGKNTYQATSTFVVAPFPALVVNVDEEASGEGCKVKGAGGYMSGTKVTLKATAAKGWVFAGWGGVEGGALSLLNPSLSLVTGDSDASYDAAFLRVCDDWLYVAEYSDGTDSEDSGTLKLTAGADVASATNAIASLVDSGSLPKLTVSGLPAGLKFDGRTCLLSGAPRSAGVFYATVKAENAGGYRFVRVIRIAVKAADGTEPEEEEEENSAGIYLDELDFLATGEKVDIVVDVPQSEGGSAVKSVQVSGLPKGVSSSVEFDEFDDAFVLLSGVPSEAGRTTVKFSVAYSDNSRAVTVHSFIVEDSGSSYLSVVSADESLGTVSGEGVYAAGETVKLSARPARGCVFAGWWADALVDGESDEIVARPFGYAGVDYRTSAVSFQMATDLMGTTVAGEFAASGEDSEVAISLFEDFWEISPDEDSSLAIDVSSLSLPTLKVTGLPKGVSFDKNASRLVYSSSDRSKLSPGVYIVAVNAQNVSRAKAETAYVTVSVPIEESEFFAGYGLDQYEGYAVQAGAALEDSLEDLAAVYNSLVADGYRVTLKNLPTGIKVSTDRTSGDPVYAFAGVPTKPGTFTVAVNASGNVDGERVNENGMFFITVAALPDSLVGTFNGSVRMTDVYDAGETQRTVPVGSLTVTALASGKLTAKIARPTGTFTLSAACWDAVSADEEAAEVTMFDRAGRSLYLMVDLSAGADEPQLLGSFAEDEAAGKNFDCSAQRNAFAARDEDALAIAAGLKGSYVFSSAGEEEMPNGGLYLYEFNPSEKPADKAMAVTIDANGAAKFAGKYGTKRISGSTVLAVGSDGGGSPTARAELVVRHDAESVAIATVSFAFDAESGEWTMDFVDDGGTIRGAAVETYKSDCESCGL